MVGLKQKTERELLDAKESFLAHREKLYKKVQDFSKADYEATRQAMARMKMINLDVAAIDRELNLRKE